VIQRCNHVSIPVKDLDGVVAWFRDKMGCTNIWQSYEYKGELIETAVGIPGAPAGAKGADTGFRAGVHQVPVPAGPDAHGQHE